MGHLDRRGSYSSFLKMNIATWLSLILGVITLATPALSSEPRVVCYYTNWSVYRPGTARFNPQNINPYLCTHLIYAFGGFTKDNTLKPFDKYQDIEKGGYAKFTGLKTYNKNLKTLLAIGGWNEGSTRFSPMVASREKRKEFVRNAIKFLRQNRFDGLDLDWEYPAFRDGGKPKDRENYAKLVKELREEFDREAEKTGKPRLLLTMAVPAGIEYIQKGFDVKTLNQYLDWMNLLTYDYHSAFEPAVNHHAPLYPLEEPNEYSVDTELNIDYTIKFYLENGADPDKLVLGIPTYGRSYTLFNADAVEIGSPADGPGEQGDATREKGYLAYYEICESLKPKTKKRSASDEDSEEYEDEEEEEWTVMHPNPEAMGPVAFKGNQWVGYDDIDIVRKKGEYVAENGLGGIMFWSIDNDDFRGNCHEKPYPLIEAAKEAYIAKLGTTNNAIATRTSKPANRASSGSRRRNRPKNSSTTTTPKPASKSTRRKSSTTSTTPSWNNTPEPPTTPDPGSDFKCVDEGFFPHPRDCKKYFWCLDSGPSNLGIVAHQFTCPSGLFFNKAADSCDFARNVLCKVPASTTKAPATKAATTKAPTTVTTTTTRKPVRLSTKSSVLFRTSTTPEPESEEYEYESAEDITDEDAEDPRVIKELIDLIKKVGGVEQLEKQLHLAESSASTDGASTTTATPFNKKLYQKVLERARGKNKYPGSNSIVQTAQNSRRGPQNQGLEDTADKDRLLKKDRPQYTTINRQRAVSSTPEPEDSEEDDQLEEPVQSRARAVESQARESQARVGSVGTTAKPLQYVNIRRARPTTTSDTADDTASRNALFERAEPYVSVSQSNSLDYQSSRKENVPEYVTIRRQRPTTEETTTVQYRDPESEVEQETALEREISSQPQYTSIIRARGTTVSVTDEPTNTEPPFIRPRYTTVALSEELSTPEPTTVLAVRISSLLNSPSSDEEAETTVPQTTEAELTTVSSTTSRPTTTTTTTTTTAAPLSSTRRNLLRRRGSTTTTSTTPGPSTTTTQVSARNYTFVRRRRPLQNPNRISDSDSDLELSRKIRSTTPDSREVNGASLDRESRQRRRFRSRYQYSQTEDSVAAAAVSRGQFRPRSSPDEVVSLTPVEVEPQFVPRQSFSSRTQRQFRGRTTVDAVVDSEASAATVETRRPVILPRGRNRFTGSSSTEATIGSSTEPTPSQRRPTFARFSPRPFGRTTVPASTRLDDEDNNEAATETTQRTPIRIPFGRSRPISSTSAPISQARRLPFPSRVLTTPQSLVSEIDSDDEPETKVDDISLSESAIEEKEHYEEEIEDEIEEAPKRRIIVKKIRAQIATEESPTEAIPVDDSGKRRFKIIRRRPATTTTTTTEEIILTNPPITQSPRVRKVIRKKINRIIEEEPEIIAKSIGSLETLKITTTVAPTTESFINYGEKKRFFTTATPFTSPTSTTTTEPATEKIVEETTDTAKIENLQNVLDQEENVTNNEDVNNKSISSEEVAIQQKEIEYKETETQETTIESDNKNTKDSTTEDLESDSKPEVSISTEQEAIDLSNTKEAVTEEPTATEPVEISPETTTTTVLPSPTPRTRLPFRSQKRLFTSTTEPIPSSSRTFSRKYNPGVYTSPASIPTRAPIVFRPAVTRRPPLFTRRPFTTARTTTKTEEEVEPEYSDEEILDEEPENPFVFVPSSQLFTRKPDNNNENVDDEEEESEEIFEDGNENDQEEEEPLQRITSTTRRPFRPRLINSNTFRTSTSTTELPKRFGASQNRTTVYNRFSSNRPVNDTKTRVANVPLGYNSPVAVLTPKVPTLKNDTQGLENNETTTSVSVTEIETTTDDYLEMTESTSTLSDNTNTDTPSIYTNESETATAEMEISTDDYLEFTEQTTYYPSTQDYTGNARTVYYQNTASNTETTTEPSPHTTTNTPIPPVIKTQYNKLFSVSRVVEVSSKLDKHRLNKNNETTLIEEGQVMIEKKPVVDKIGEVSRFSLIKIVEDEIPIYLTRLGHVYPVENPPDNLIRIDEARNARALNYVEPPRENLVASESVNEAYRHVKTLSDLSKDDVSNIQVEHVPRDDFLSYINVEKSDKTQEEPLFSQWQFVPAAYENEKNKAANIFEVVTPRSMLTNPSTLSLEGLFKTEMPLTARKVDEDRSQPFLVYSASVPTQKEEANIVKLEVLKPEGRSILTFAKGQEFNGGSSVEQATVKSPISVSIVPNTDSPILSTTTTATSTTENIIKTSPIVEMLTNKQSTVTESTTISTMEDITTTETVPEETTTVKLSPVELKRAKYGGFPRRPIIKPGNLTRFNSPRTVKKANSTISVSSFQKSNKTVSFSPSKSRFSVSRSQNVPIDIRKKSTSKTPKVFTTESPRSTTERKLYYKAPRPTFRPAFIPRRTTLPPTTEDS